MSMEYNWMAQSAPQAFPYMTGFDPESSVLGGVSAASITNLEAPGDNSAFMPDTYNAFFDGSMSGPPTSLAALQPSQSPSPGQNSSVHTDGAALDVDHLHYSGTSNNGDLQRRRSSSAEKDVTPAQSRRKAQNRAAQRAFRERKERHVRDLEAKLNLLTTTTSSLQSDNERLKLMLQRAQTENEILRASAAAHSTSPPQHESSLVDDPRALPNSHSSKFARSGDASSRFDPLKLAHGLMSTGGVHSPGRLGSPSGSETHLLSASATWDLLQSHPLYLSGAVDIGEVCERLKKLARCDGVGPMFDEEEVRRVIEDVGRSSHDGLI